MVTDHEQQSSHWGLHWEAASPPASSWFPNWGKPVPACGGCTSESQVEVSCVAWKSTPNNQEQLIHG